jgi:alpha-L-fucosidase 2
MIFSVVLAAVMLPNGRAADPDSTVIAVEAREPAQSETKAVDDAPDGSPSRLDACNVVWDSPSQTSFGSMPLGNGDVGVNVWVEPNGDLLFYVAKVDAFDSFHALPKLGRVRVRFEPSLDTAHFSQRLVLRKAAVEISAGDLDLRVWIDANHPVIRVTGSSASSRTVTASFESLRPAADKADQQDRLVLYYRNEASEWAKQFEAQNSAEFVAAHRHLDPLFHRTSGCRLSGDGFVRKGLARNDRCSLIARNLRHIDLSVRVLSCKTPSAEEWLAEIEKPIASDWNAHCEWWNAFWDRSHVFVTGCGDAPIDLDQCRFVQFPVPDSVFKDYRFVPPETNSLRITQRYALERFCQAAAGRGTVPPPFNGSLFLMDMPAGAKSFDRKLPSGRNADYRPWGRLPFMWQNTRHPYWSMPSRGDFDTMLPGMRFVRDGLEFCRDRCKKTFNHEGAFIYEASQWFNVGVWGLPKIPAHLRYHFLATVETTAMMCDYYDHTRDRAFLENILLPWADESLLFYELHYPRRDGQGRMVMAPAGTMEIFANVTNPNTEVGAIRFVLAKLLSFDIDETRRATFERMLEIVPDLPVRRVKGMDLLAVGQKYDPGRVICESPELHSVYPFRQAWLGTSERLAMARQSFHLRTTSLDGTVDEQPVETGGWQAAPVQAAYLGLPREAARLASINFNDRFSHWFEHDDASAYPIDGVRPRFPGFWEFKMDATPDCDHGANSANALQSMLLQNDGTKILLLPAWPEDWDVEFKLHAADNTTVECSYKDGEVRELVVTPATRAADIVDLSTPENRIRNLVQVACADRNYVFGLPPMLDGQPKPGKATASWLSKYGESVSGVRGAPWPHCVYRDNVVYVHTLDDEVQRPDIPATLVSETWLTPAGTKPVTILKLEYAEPIEPFAKAAASAGSLTTGRPLDDGTVDLGRIATFDRIELTLDMLQHRRGAGEKIELQAQNPDGTWKTAFSGTAYGPIFSSRIPPVRCQVVRLKNTGPSLVRQLDLFETSGE